MHTGEVMKELRIVRNMTQNEFAEKLFVTRQTVSNWERGITPLSDEMIQKMAEVLDVSVAEFYVNAPIPLLEKIDLRLPKVTHFVYCVIAVIGIMALFVLSTALLIIGAFNVGFLHIPYSAVWAMMAISDIAAFVMVLGAVYALIVTLLVKLYWLFRVKKSGN